jgi:hypothetical protein
MESVVRQLEESHRDYGRWRVGSWLVVAKADGFRSAEVSLDPSASGSIALNLLPTRRTRGRLLDGVGRPIAAAKVLAVVAEPPRRSFYDTEDVAVTDEKGEFELRHVPAGMQVSFITVVQDRAPQESRSLTFTSEDARASEFDVVATGATGATVRGVVLDSTGRPAARANVTATLDPAYLARFGGSASRMLTLAGISEPTTTTGPDGSFEIRGVPAGQLTLRARLPGFVSRPERITAVDGQAANIRLTMTPVVATTASAVVP